MSTITFGIRADSIDHPLVGRALKISREYMNLTGPISNFVDFVPLLQKLPGSIKSRGQKLHQELLDTYGGMFKDVESRLQRGEDVPDCFAKQAALIKDKEQLDFLDLVMLISAFMIGGVESTAGIIQWFMALIPAYPEIQAKAHEEIDRVVGRGRLPTINDEPHLPYIRAIVKELGRCCNPFWLGAPHLSTADFTYGNHFIPMDTVVLLNTYTMHHDPKRYPDPHQFNPDRYINDAISSAKSTKLLDPMERDHWMFGAGRRICLGMSIAETSIFLAVSNLLWAFRMDEVPGEPIDLQEYDGLSGRSPVPFQITCVPRDANVARLFEL